MQARHERRRSICSDNFSAGLALVLQHVLHQIDAAARGIVFISKQHIRRASGGAEAAVDAGADHRFRGAHGGIGERFRREAGLHAHPPQNGRSEDAKGIEGAPHARFQRHDAGRAGWKAGTRARISGGACIRTASPPSAAAASRSAVPVSSSAIQTLPAAPVHRPLRAEPGDEFGARRGADGRASGLHHEAHCRSSLRATKAQLRLSLRRLKVPCAVISLGSALQRYSTEGAKPATRSSVIPYAR